MCNFVEGKFTDYNTETDKVYESDDLLAFISPKWWVNNPGNVIIIPKQHFENLYDLPDELLIDIHLLSKKISIAMKNSYDCDGISTRQHNEPDGGQDVWHYHLHIFPRWENDKLYQNHDNKRFVSAEERKEYAQKLKELL